MVHWSKRFCGTVSTVVAVMAMGFSSFGGAGQAAEPTLAATFACISIRLPAPGVDPKTVCAVHYRVQGEEPWREALPLWYDTVDREYRGSIVDLRDDTVYEVQLTISGRQPLRTGIRTRANTFPVARTVILPEGRHTEPIVITEGGKPGAYVAYRAGEGGTTVDAAGAHDVCVAIQADYVLLTGVTCVNARRSGISIARKRHHIVIDDCEISAWGRPRADGYGERDAGVNAGRGAHHLVVQRCRIHDPNHGADPWSVDCGHPGNPYHAAGPNAICLAEGRGGNVIRWNDIYAGPGRYFEDAIGNWWGNGSMKGFPGADSDIYGNRLRNCVDDMIEADGGNRNVRIWGNYISDSFKAVSTAPLFVGPIYVFRNVFGLCRKDVGQDGMGFNGTGSHGGRSGRVYLFHNTMLTVPRDREQALVGLWGGYRSGPVKVTSRNNIWSGLELPYAVSYADRGLGVRMKSRTVHRSNSYDYDLTTKPHDVYLDPRVEPIPRPAARGFNPLAMWPRGMVHTPPGTQEHGVVGIPVYRDGHGWDEGEGRGRYQLADDSPGVDAGLRLPNFNDGYTGAGPDTGAHEIGAAPMRFGIAAAPPGYRVGAKARESADIDGRDALVD